ncbi:MAG: signal peptide peptidase SppA [Xanthobacteraceae bacterium]
MSLDADLIVDRRRIRRKLTFWRVAAIVVAIIAVVLAGMAVRQGGVGISGPLTARIARISITGVIRNDHDRVEALEKLAKSRAARAVIVHIDSPGGTTTGAEQLHYALRLVAAKKPVAVVIDGMAASGGYIAAMAGDHIVAQGNSLVGSIGVLFQYPNFTDLMKTVGVQVEEVKSSPLKASPNPFEPTSPEARAALASLVSDSYQWFRNMVQERRGIEEPTLATVTDGRVFTGRQALELKLIDQVGQEQTAVDWLVKNKGIDQKLPVRDWKLDSSIGSLPFLHLGASLLHSVGLGDLARRIEQSSVFRTFERLNLDGLLALWHPQPSN